MEMIKEMSIDLETYSDVDIKKSGASTTTATPFHSGTTDGKTTYRMNTR